MLHGILEVRLLGVYLLVALFLTGCASTDPYHTRAWESQNCHEPREERCTQSYYQEYPGYDLAFVEFTERGNTFNDEWKKEVLSRIRKRQSESGIVTLVFIHGWKHNAEESDTNLKEFRKSLSEISESSPLRGRRLVGVYVGWRGASIKAKLLEQLTFWDRKAVAEEVGKGGVTQLLLELDQIDRMRKKNVLAIIGHSFGGAITVSATAEIISSRLSVGEKNNQERGAIGDALMVLNPAIEANQVLSMVEAALNNPTTSAATPLFVSISSDADSATHYAFPVGQTIGLFFTWRQKDLMRSYYFDRLSKEKLTLREEHLDATTVGNFAPYLTHRLTADISGEKPVIHIQPCENVPEECVPKGLTSLGGHPTIGPLSANYPLYFIKTDENVMSGHNDIFNPVIHTFMFVIIDDVVRATLKDETDYKGDEIPYANVLTKPDEFNRRFERFYNSDKDK